MKIGLITPSYSRDERDWCIPVLREYAGALAARGVEVHVFPLAYPPAPGDYRVGAVQVHAVGGERLMRWARDPRVFARAVGVIAGEARRGRFDALHAIFADECGVVTLAAARRLGVPAVVTLAGGELAALRAIGYGAQLSWPRALAVRLALRGAARVVAPSEYVAAQVRARTGRPPDVIPWGIDAGRFRPPARKPESDDVLCVAELRPVKNGAMLVRAFVRAARGRAGSRLRLVGGGDEPPAPRDAPVLREPKMAWDALPGVYAEAGVFAMASWHEAFCLAALEAMACGLPLVGTSVGVLPEACAAPAPAGACVAPGDEDGLAGALGRLLDDPGLRAEMGGQGRARAEACYAWEVVAGRALQLYHDVAVRPR